MAPVQRASAQGGRQGEALAPPQPPHQLQVHFRRGQMSTLPLSSTSPTRLVLAVALALALALLAALLMALQALKHQVQLLPVGKGACEGRERRRERARAPPLRRSLPLELLSPAFPLEQLQRLPRQAE